MKLADHVDKLRNLIEAAFDKRFARLGISKTNKLEMDKLPEDVRPKRQRFEDMLENHIGETGDYEHAREKLIDELTFTLFNRLAAVKVMEAASLFPPILTKQTEHGDRSFGHKAWLELRPDMRSEELEGIREYLKHAFDELGATLPLYNRRYPYAMLPDAVSLNEIIDAFNAVDKDSQVDSNLWQSDDVLGWMYESYNNVKKKAHKDSGDKTEYNKVSLQSQVYTPRWVVQFLVENSLGKLYLEMYPDSDIKRRFKIANAPKTQDRTPKKLHKIKVIDPACGSGNFLLYAFDFFYELYLDQIENFGADYDEKDIPKLIIENNLHGIDLDDRAVQLAQLGLFIKAKKKRRTMGEVRFKVVSSDFFLPEYDAVKHIFEGVHETHEKYEKVNERFVPFMDNEQKKMIREIWGDLRYAYKFGSLIRLNEKIQARLRGLIEQRNLEQLPLFKDELSDTKPKPVQLDMFTEQDIKKERVFSDTFFYNLKTAVENYAGADGNSFLTSKTRDAITFLELLTTQYDVATANPPYTYSADFGPKLKEFIEGNYKKPYKFQKNLYAAFIKRCHELTCSAGKIAMIHPHTFMFIKDFEDVRKFMIDKCHIDAMVDYGLDRVNLFGPGILLDATFYVLSNVKSKKEGLYFNLSTNLQEKYKKDKFLEALHDCVDGIENDRIHTLEQIKLKNIKSWPFIYWISDEFREKFEDSDLSDIADVKGGITTGSNERFLRFWWEVKTIDSSNNYANDQLKWAGYAKGGSYNKWFGNNWLKILWEDNGKAVKESLKSVMRNQSYYFREGITYSASGSKGVSFRYLTDNNVFDAGGSCIFLRDHDQLTIQYLMGLLNSKLCFYVVDCLNPTVNTQVGDLQRVPIAFSDSIIREVSACVSICSTIKKNLQKNSIYEEGVFKSPISGRYKDSIFGYFNYENHLLTQVLINEAIINEKIFEVYELTENDKAMVLAKEGESIGGLPVLAEARTAYLSTNFTKSTKKEEIENNHLVPFVDGKNNFDLPIPVVDFINSLPTKEFTPEEIESVASGFPTLYQSNNDLEEFCIRHQVNPINVWYWFKESNVIPQQRMHTLAMEFLADMIREILMEDEDGIIPLVPNAGEKVLLDRIEEKFREKGFTPAQYSSFDSVLGRPLPEYLNRYFFAELSDHLNLFMYLPKTPFIWHLSSGPEQGFDCYLIIYKWSRDKLMRLRSVYIENRERSLINRQSDLSGNESADAQNEKDRIIKQLREIESFKVKIDELLAEGYNPILDDGVGKNIAPLQKKKMIPYEVLNEGQLKKYLNADW